jgi:hypothetical protein
LVFLLVIGLLALGRGLVAQTVGKIIVDEKSGGDNQNGCKKGDDFFVHFFFA